MKKIKSFSLFIFIIIFITGCDVNYNLKIDKKMNIFEDISALEEKQYNDLSYDFLLDRISGVYADRYGGVEIYTGDNKYEFGVVSEGTKIGNSIKKEYSSFTSFSQESAIFRDLIKEYDVTETEDIVNINITLNDDLYDDSKLEYTFIPENININIDLPYRVLNNNADIKKGNKYTWNITKDKRNINLILSFDKKHLSNHIYILNIAISYGILIVLGILITVGIVSYFVSKKIKSINKI